MFTWHCAVSPRPAHSVRARKGWKRCRQIRGCSTFVQAGKSAATRHCVATPYPARSVQARQGQRSTAPCRPFHPARSIRTERCMRTRHCAVSLNPIRFIEVGMGSIHRLSSRQALPRLRYLCREGRAHMTLSLTPHPACPVRTGKGMARPAAWHIQSPRLLRGLCENSIQLFSRGSLASSGKDHFHNWKEQSCLSVRMDTSPSENLNFSAQLSIQERTRQAMCSVPASKWYNGIAS